MAPSPRRRLYDVMDGKIIVHSPDRFDELFGDGSVNKASKIIIIIIIIALPCKVSAVGGGGLRCVGVGWLLLRL